MSIDFIVPERLDQFFKLYELELVSTAEYVDTPESRHTSTTRRFDSGVTIKGMIRLSNDTLWHLTNRGLATQLSSRYTIQVDVLSNMARFVLGTNLHASSHIYHDCLITFCRRSLIKWIKTLSRLQYTRLTTTRLGSLVAAMYRVLRNLYRPLAVENGRESERA